VLHAIGGQGVGQDLLGAGHRTWVRNWLATGAEWRYILKQRSQAETNMHMKLELQVSTNERLIEAARSIEVAIGLLAMAASDLALHQHFHLAEKIIQKATDAELLLASLRDCSLHA